MRALRSRNVQSSEDSSEKKSEDAEYDLGEHVSKKVKKRKHKQTSDGSEHQLDAISEENLFKKKKGKKSKSKSIYNTDEIVTNEFSESVNSKITSEINTENEQQLDAAPEKHRSKKKKKSKRTNTYQEDGLETNASPETTKSEMKTENDSVVKKKKLRKFRKEKIDEKIEVDASETDNQEKLSKRKKIKKSKKKQGVVENIAAETEINESVTTNSNTSTEELRNYNRTRKLRKKKSRELKLFPLKNSEESKAAESENNPEQYENNEIESMSDWKRTFGIPENEIENTKCDSSIEFRKPLKKIDEDAYRPKFSTAVTSTAMKPKRPENVGIEEPINIKRERRISRKSKKSLPGLPENTTRSINESKEFKMTDSLFDKSVIQNNEARYSPKFSTAFTSTMIKPKKPEMDNESPKLGDNLFEGDLTSKLSTFNKSSETESFSKTEKTYSIPKKQRRTTENLSKVLGQNETLNKISEIFINSTSTVAITDSREASQVEQNTFNITNTIEPEITSDESFNSSKTKNSTFDRSVKDKIPWDASVISISSSPDKTSEHNTFNKTKSEPEITSDEDVKANLNLKSHGSSNASLYSSKSKRSGTKDETSTNLGDTFNKTPKNASLRQSKNSLSETHFTPGINNFRMSERLSDISDGILESVVNISEETKRNTFEISQKLSENNSSGEWLVEKYQPENIQKHVLNETFETDKENADVDSNETVAVSNDQNSTSPINKTLRKKWLILARHSAGAQALLESIGSPKLKKKISASKIVEKVMKTPKELYTLQKPTTNSKLSIKKSPTSVRKSAIKSIKKSNIASASKRTIMPNFALIHKKANEKLESLLEYSQRKKERAEKLLNSTRKSTKTEEVKGKSSRQLFTETKTSEVKSTAETKSETKDVVKTNRFGFKIDVKPSHIPVMKRNIPVPIPKAVTKPSVFTKIEAVALANKNKPVTNNKDRRRDILKGVRTNRRFDLLMEMRNK